MPFVSSSSSSAMLGRDDETDLDKTRIPFIPFVPFIPFIPEGRRALLENIVLFLFFRRLGGDCDCEEVGFVVEYGDERSGGGAVLSRFGILP